MVYLFFILTFIFSDLRPDNILLDSFGHLLLTYCSDWANVDIRDDLDAVDLSYAAPGKPMNIDEF